MREYTVEWDGSDPEEARVALPAEPGSQPQMGEHVLMRDLRGRRWAARVGWDPRLGWVLVPQPPDRPGDKGGRVIEKV